MPDTSMPEKVFEGTWDEIASHAEEVRQRKRLRLLVLPEEGQENEETLADSLKDLLEEAKHLQKGEPIRYSNVQAQRFVDGIREDLQRQGLRT